ncbi:Formamidopyrimidine-DNA glycosylase [Planctomycetes bacterium Pan216]|uniref:DNA-(apurinic or apyrimidinic site) lyase n=1 Tax=Kolteria novifilia TaxID=2527975 RepID=A0A518B7C2_9BACT|nr:Formamidopyrimidine-DNA glycosylase [Planctomycetes bacterium Pan216]
MPEGDTIFRTAVRLRSVLVGKRIEAASSQGRRQVDAAPLLGGEIRDVEARGKHLLFAVCDERTIHSHMGMTGSWHLYRPGERWSKPVPRAALVLEVGGIVAVCFSPKTLEILSRDGLRRHRHLWKLGPDLLATRFDEREALLRFRLHERRPIGEILLDQRVVCGIGNVYKSEALFLMRRSPFDPTGSLSDEELGQLLARTRDLMRRNLVGFKRQTRFGRDGDRVWVYGRVGKPCLECGTMIQMRRQGELGRSTYWCPACQPATDVST